MTDKNTIYLDPKRCIYVKNSENSKISEIYFSNYYLKQVIDTIDNYDDDKSNIIKFNDGEFMNNEIIPEEDKALMMTAKEKIPEKLATKDTKINKETLNVLVYSKITYTHQADAAAADAAEDAVLDSAIPEDDILDTLKKPITISDEKKFIFKNKAQLRQYLKYDGLWYRVKPTRHLFKDRAGTKFEEEEEEEAGGEQEGGKKTTTRRRRKAGYNKHRKSNRRR